MNIETLRQALTHLTLGLPFARKQDNFDMPLWKRTSGYEWRQEIMELVAGVRKIEDALAALNKGAANHDTHSLISDLQLEASRLKERLLLMRTKYRFSPEDRPNQDVEEEE